MPRLDVVVQCPVFDSFRVEQVAGMFDVPLAEKATETFSVDVPGADEPWEIGLIVGPSGSGKSTIARRAFGEALYTPRDWPADRAVVDGLGQLPIKQITGLFTAVGFSSPPSWIKPYHVLSGGERFRCDLARALAVGCGANEEGRLEIERPIVAFDEFTSVVDRNVARVGAAAIAKAIRSGRTACRFVAVTCHYDVAEWLEPDWVLDMATRRLTWGRLRRPRVRLALVRCGRRAWDCFARHHYLSGKLSFGARCYLALWEQEPVAFCAVLPVIASRGKWRLSRVVTLPDYQGIGIGTRVVEGLAEEYLAEGERFFVTTGHPGMIAHCRDSRRWRIVRVKRTGSRASIDLANYRGTGMRSVVSFEYRGGSDDGNTSREGSTEEASRPRRIADEGSAELAPARSDLRNHRRGVQSKLRRELHRLSGRGDRRARRAEQDVSPATGRGGIET
ncbi:MAG: GNAT family N-acetyltransferase [Pirellulales bacterium]|nr:GNAT family N-acetyltransferase [Pirellulales bacterium]